MITRRAFVQRSLTGAAVLAVAGQSLVLTACGNLGGELLTAFKNILGILEGAGILTANPLVTAVSAALSEVISALTAYANAPAADKATLGLKLATLIQIANEQLQTFYASLGLTGTLATVIESLVAVILSTLAGLLPSLPVPTVMVARANLTKRVPYIPVARSARVFRNDYNTVLTAHGYPKVNF
jgi:hypothetical protein